MIQVSATMCGSIRSVLQLHLLVVLGPAGSARSLHQGSHAPLELLSIKSRVKEVIVTTRPCFALPFQVVINLVLQVGVPGFPRKPPMVTLAPIQRL